MKIRYKIQVFTTGWLLILLLLTGLGTFFMFRWVMLDLEKERMINLANSITKAIHHNEELNKNGAKWLRAFLPKQGMIRIVNQNKQAQIVVTETVEWLALPRRFLTHEQNKFVHFRGEQIVVVSRPLVWENGQIVTLEVIGSLRHAEELIRLLGMVLVISSTLVLIPSYQGGHLLANILLKPIHLLIGAMNQSKEKKMYQMIKHLPHDRRDELSQLAESYNQLMELLQEQFQKQRHFISDASHELKTPLTIMDSYVEMLARWGKENPAIVDETIDVLTSEIARMRRMSGQLLALLQDEAVIPNQIEQVNLFTISQQVIERMMDTFHRVIRCEVDDSELLIMTDPQKIKQLLFIILDNAIKYSDAGEIVVILKRVDHMVNISVIDEGIGIKATDLARIFDRFYRAEAARERERSGNGLGLAIAHDLCENLGGSIHISSGNDGGTTVLIELPLTHF